MQAIVLVGGEGTRLRPLTYGTPKPMVPIMNVPFLARTLERLYEAGIRDVILPAGYMPQAIIDYFGDGSKLGMKITYVIEETPLGTAGALKNVEQHITGPFFVLNGDVLHQPRSARDDGLPPSKRAASATLHSFASKIPRRSAASCTTQTGRVSAVRREAAQGQRADQRNQRRHVSARARGARLDSRRAQRLDRTRDVPAVIAADKATLRLHDRRLLDRPRPARAISGRAPRHP